MYVHFLVDSLYTDKFIKFIDDNFDISRHIFILFNKELRYLTSNHIITPDFFSIYDLKHIYKKMTESKAIFLHSLFDTRTLLLLAMNKKYLSKTFWVLWGGDLYNYWLKDKHSPKEWMVEKIKSFVIRNVRGIVALVEEDYLFAKQKYNTAAKYIYAFYPNPVDFETLNKVYNQSDPVQETKVKQILVGNSAAPTNNHFEILDALARYQLKDVTIICPLSYGPQDYADQVEQYGYSLFGSKFVALREFLSPLEYAKILVNIDVAIFAHKRQQALGNILSLLYLGKKVYVRSDTSTWNFFKRLSVRVFDTKKILEGSETNIFAFDEGIAFKNREIVKSEFSEERCVQLWKNVFMS